MADIPLAPAPPAVVTRRSTWLSVLAVFNIALLAAVALLGWDDFRLRAEAKSKATLPVAVNGQVGAMPAVSTSAPSSQPPAPGVSASAPNSTAAATPFDAYLEWVQVQENNRAEMRKSLGQIATIAQQMHSRPAPATPQEAAAVKKAYADYHEFLRGSAQRWQDNLAQSRQTLTVPADCQAFDQEYTTALNDEREVFVGRGIFLLGDPPATEPSALSGRAVLSMAGANSRLQLLQLGQGRYSGRVRINLSPMAP